MLLGCAPSELSQKLMLACMLAGRLAPSMPQMTATVQDEPVFRALLWQVMHCLPNKACSMVEQDAW